MKIVALIAILAAFPCFLLLLKSPRTRQWLYILLGALPFLYAPLNLDGSLISWPQWPGHTRGLTLTIVDPLAAAICVRYARNLPRPPYLWCFIFYFCALLPALFFSGQFLPGSFFVFQTLRITVYFYAIYLVVGQGAILQVAYGIATAMIFSGLLSAYQAATGAAKAPGLLDHQNLTGLAINLCTPFVLAIALRSNKLIFAAALGAAAIGAIAGGSRATIVFLGIAIFLTLLIGILSTPSRKVWAFTGFACLMLIFAAPFAIQKLSDRADEGFTIDAERVAFEKAAHLMISDNPMGVGLNQFVGAANVGEYFSRAGVRWGVGARSTSVHNVYLLSRAEGGILGLIGLLTLLSVPPFGAIRAFVKRRGELRDVSMACGLALLLAALHSQYEWVLVTVTPQYLLAAMIGVISSLEMRSRLTEKTRRP